MKRDQRRAPLTYALRNILLPVGRFAAFDFLVVGSILLMLVCLSSAQVDRAGLSGTVTDPSGRMLPQTHVMAVQNATGLRRETMSSPDGSYSIPELPVGVYTITFEHDGFKTLTFVDVEQVIGRTRTLDATLQVAGGERARPCVRQFGADGPQQQRGDRPDRERAGRGIAAERPQLVAADGLRPRRH